VRDTGLTAADAWAIADDRSTWRALRPIAGYAQQWQWGRGPQRDTGEWGNGTEGRNGWYPTRKQLLDTPLFRGRKTDYQHVYS